MLYTVVCLIAIVIHLIINHDFIFKKPSRFRVTADKDYHRYLNCILLYFITDALWGLAEGYKLPNLLYLDTILYYIAALFSVILWCRYIISYLDLKGPFCTYLRVSCTLIFIVDVIVLIVNFFKPVFFWVDPDGTYHGGSFRYVAYVVQIILFVSIGVKTLLLIRDEDPYIKRRNFMFCAYSFSMVASILAQGLFPMLPMYTVGLMIGTCELHVFVLEAEMDEFRRKLMNNEERLRESMDIISNAGFGIWKIKMREDGRHQMEVNDRLRDILGITGMDLTPEELYKYYHSRLNDDVGIIESDDYESMRHGILKSRLLSYNHPEKGSIFLNAGGARYVQTDGEILISGYCGDITEQRKNELRSNRIISTLARSYEFVNYIVMADRSFTTTSNSLYLKDDDISGGDVTKAIDFSCDQRISDEFRAEMKIFSDLSTIDQRMKDLNIIINQFKDNHDIWHEWSYIVVDRNADGTVAHLIWAMRKIEDEKRAEIRRQQILDDNIAANKAKTVFLQNMSHEIRTPLNALFGFSQLLGLPDGTWTPEEKDTYNKYIFNNYNMLEMLIGDIIDTADSEHGNYRIEIDDVQVNSICRNAMMSVEYRKPVEVNMYFTSDVPDDYVIRSDGRRIQQVLVNYLSNACKHTEEGEIHLHCSATEHPGRLTFSVADTGEGVPPEKADVIFNRFTKLNQFVQGSGLGLNICLTIANKLGGEVYLDKSYTDGARFVFIIDNK